jgi:hypothetical protein
MEFEANTAFPECDCNLCRQVRTAAERDKLLASRLQAIGEAVEAVEGALRSLARRVAAIEGRD